VNKKFVLQCVVLSSALALLASGCGGAATPPSAPTAAPTAAATAAATAASTAAPTATSGEQAQPTGTTSATTEATGTVAATAAPSATGAGTEVDKSKLVPELSMYNWSDYIAQEVLDKFQEEYGVKVVVDNFDSNEALFAKFQAGGNPGYDLIVPSDYMVEKMIAAGMLEKIDMNNVPNIKNLDPAHYKLYFDPTGEYSVAYFWGTTGLAYDSQALGRDITSWKEIFEPPDDLKGKIGMIDDQRESLGAALRYKGHSANSTEAAQIEEAKNVLLEQKKDVKGYYSSVDNRNNLVSGDVVVAMIYTGDAIVAGREKPSIKYILPEGVTTVWQDNLTIPKGGKSKYTAEVFINFLLRPDIAAVNANKLAFPTPNGEALKQDLIDKDLLNNKAIYPDLQAMGNKLEFLQRGDAKAQALYDRAWTEVGIGQ
jgi:spermidine/putrescine transport system substrate-binding protein